MSTQKEVFLQKLLDDARLTSQYLLESEAAFEAEVAWADETDDLDSYQGPSSLELHEKAVHQAQLVMGGVEVLERIRDGIEEVCQSEDYKNWESSHERN